MKWMGIPNYNGTLKTAYGYNPRELYFELVDRGWISEFDYDPVVKFACELHDVDYDKLYSAFLDYCEEEEGFPDEFSWFADHGVDADEMTDENWLCLIYYEVQNRLNATSEFYDDEGDKIEFSFV